MSPVISGLIGSILAASICGYWLKKFPFDKTKKEQKSLTKKYRQSIRFSNFLFATPLIVGLSLFYLSVIPNNDWRAGFIILGLALGLPALSTLIAANGSNKPDPKEAFIALAISQHTPVALLLFFNILGVCLALIGFIHVLA